MAKANDVLITGLAPAAALFVMRFVPKTQQRSLEAIESLWVKKPA